VKLRKGMRIYGFVRMEKKIERMKIDNRVEDWFLGQVDFPEKLVF
jgi:hypothetical protein